MDPVRLKRTTGNGPEKIIQDAIMRLLKGKDWYVIHTHGNLYQQGLPDLFACHCRYGTRWIEVKNPLAYSFTPAQLEVFRHFAAKEVGIWILTAGTEYEYQKLFEYPNWSQFLGHSKVQT